MNYLEQKGKTENPTLDNASNKEMKAHHSANYALHHLIVHRNRKEKPKLKKLI